MAQPTYNYKVTTPFAINGSKDEIPTTTDDGSVSLENGYGTLYETPPSEGGRFIRRGEWNYLINFLYNAIKELQDVITAGEFTVSASQTLTSILPIALGGTGASTEEQARSNLGLGDVDNTSDADKPISTATQEALDGKVNKSGDTMTGVLIIDSTSLNKITTRNNATEYNIRAADIAAYVSITLPNNKRGNSGMHYRASDNVQYYDFNVYDDANDLQSTIIQFLQPNTDKSRIDFTSDIIRFNGSSCEGTTAFFQSLANKIRNYI